MRVAIIYLVLTICQRYLKGFICIVIKATTGLWFKSFLHLHFVDVDTDAQNTVLFGSRLHQVVSRGRIWTRAIWQQKLFLTTPLYHLLMYYLELTQKCSRSKWISFLCKGSNSLDFVGYIQFLWHVLLFPHFKMTFKKCKSHS